MALDGVEHPFLSMGLRPGVLEHRARDSLALFRAGDWTLSCDPSGPLLEEAPGGLPVTTHGSYACIE
jgi:hypothetical protein